MSARDGSVGAPGFLGPSLAALLTASLVSCGAADAQNVGTGKAKSRVQAPNTADAPAVQAEDAAEAKAMERFLTLLEKNPRRGTALDRVYGYHVERGTLDGLIKTYQDRTAKDPKD